MSRAAESVTLDIAPEAQPTRALCHHLAGRLSPTVLCDA